MENEKKIVGEDETVEEIVAATVDGTIDDITEVQTNGELQEVEFIPLDSLLYDSEDASAADSSYEDANFESFFAEYRLLIAENLDAARKKNDDSAESAIDTDSTESAEPTVEQTPEPAPEKKKKAKKTKKTEPDENEEWSGEITLAPEEYEALDEESEIFIELPEEKAEEEVIDLIGEEKTTTEEAPTISEEDIQISFFAEEKKQSFLDTDDPKEKKYDPENPRKIDAIFDFLELFIFTLVAVVLLTSFVFKHSVVEGDSMKQTLADGEHLIIWDAFYTPERYDIVVFEDYSIPSEKLKKPIVKRIIGLPGDTVEIRNASNGGLLVYVNGELIDEEYAYYGIRKSDPKTGIWTVGEDKLFVMGDNRYNSTDSRADEVGLINTDRLLGKVVLRFYPFKDFKLFD